MILALIGATTGGLLTNAVLSGGHELSTAGTIGAILGSLATLLTYRTVMGRRAV